MTSGEVGVHEGDRGELVVSPGVLRAPRDVARHQRDVGTGQLAGQLFHLDVVNAGDLVVCPFWDGRRVAEELESAFLPARKVGGPTVMDLDLAGAAAPWSFPG